MMSNQFDEGIEYSPDDIEYSPDDKDLEALIDEDPDELEDDLDLEDLDPEDLQQR